MGKDGAHVVCDHTEQLVKDISLSHSAIMFGRMVFGVVVSMVVGAFVPKEMKLLLR